MVIIVGVLLIQGSIVKISFSLEQATVLLLHLESVLDHPFQKRHDKVVGVVEHPYAIQGRLLPAISSEAHRVKRFRQIDKTNISVGWVRLEMTKVTKTRRQRRHEARIHKDRVHTPNRAKR